MQAQLNDPITVLNLLTTTKPSLKTNFNLKDYQFDKYQFLTIRYLNTNDLDMQLIFDARNVLRGAYTHTNRQNQKKVYLKQISITKQQNIMYTMADTLIRHFNVDDQQNLNQWDGQIVSLLNSIILSDNQKYLYYLKYDLKTATNSHKLMIPMFIYQIPLAKQQEFDKWLLNQFKNKPFLPNFKAFNALKNFWMYQAKELNPNILNQRKQTTNKKPQPSINPQLMTILKAIAEVKSDEVNGLSTILTYQNLIDFYFEIQKQHLTKKTQAVQEWLFSNLDGSEKLTNLIDLMQLNPNFQKLNQNFKQLKPDDKTYQKLIQQFKLDRYWPKHKIQAVNIYRINNHSDTDSKNDNQLTLIHGTKSYSIPTLLCDGFKTIKELKSDKNKAFKNTAQGLGQGTYFARLEQASKALNYTDNPTYAKHRPPINYLLISDVKYQKIYETQKYGQYNTDADLIYGNHIGITHQYDEFVVKKPQQQTNIKYLIEVIGET